MPKSKSKSQSKSKAQSKSKSKSKSKSQSNRHDNVRAPYIEPLHKMTDLVRKANEELRIQTAQWKLENDEKLEKQKRKKTQSKSKSKSKSLSKSKSKSLSKSKSKSLSKSLSKSPQPIMGDLPIDTRQIRDDINDDTRTGEAQQGIRVRKNKEDKMKQDIPEMNNPEYWSSIPGSKKITREVFLDNISKVKKVINSSSDISAENTLMLMSDFVFLKNSGPRRIAKFKRLVNYNNQGVFKYIWDSYNDTGDLFNLSQLGKERDRL